MEAGLHWVLEWWWFSPYTVQDNVQKLLMSDLYYMYAHAHMYVCKDDIDGQVRMSAAIEEAPNQSMQQIHPYLP